MDSDLDHFELMGLAAPSLQTTSRIAPLEVLVLENSSGRFEIFSLLQYPCTVEMTFVDGLIHGMSFHALFLPCDGF